MASVNFGAVGEGRAGRNTTCNQFGAAADSVKPLPVRFNRPFRDLAFAFLCRPHQRIPSRGLYLSHVDRPFLRAQSRHELPSLLVIPAALSGGGFPFQVPSATAVVTRVLRVRARVHSQRSRVAFSELEQAENGERTATICQLQVLRARRARRCICLHPSIGPPCLH